MVLSAPVWPPEMIFTSLAHKLNDRERQRRLWVLGGGKEVAPAHRSPAGVHLGGPGHSRCLDRVTGGCMLWLS